MKLSILFIFFPPLPFSSLPFSSLPLLSFFLSDKQIVKKLYGVCQYYTYQTTALLPDIFPFWFGMAYELRLESYGQGTVPQYARRSCSSTLCGFCLPIPGVPCTYSQATPGLLNACVTCTINVRRICKQATVSKQKLEYSFLYIYLMLKAILVPRKTPLCI